MSDIKKTNLKIPFIKKTLACVLVIIVGFLILYPTNNFQAFFSQGDNGRDLYCFWRTSQGAKPYRDYWWPYGPLMPYIYSLFLLIKGISAQNVFLCKNLLILLSAVIFYQSIALIIPVSAAFVATVWFLSFNPTFSYTYNHIGGIVAILLILFNLFRYIVCPERKYIISGLLFVTLLGLVKINMGLVALFGFIFSVFLINRISNHPHSNQNERISLLGAGCSLLILIVCYLYFTWGLPSYIVRQCFPFVPSDQPTNLSLFVSLRELWKNNIAHFRSTLPNFLFGCIVLFSAVNFFLYWRRKAFVTKERSKVLSAIVILILFYILISHEYLLSAFAYRLYWTSPFSMMINFIFIAVATSRLPKYLRILFLLMLLTMAGMEVSRKHTLIAQLKVPQRQLKFGTTNIYTANPPLWNKTVTATSRYLMTHLGKDEFFLAIPYDPLYYFLAQKKSPVQELIFHEYIHISPLQENKIIRTVEQKNVNYALVSSRIQSTVQGLGSFGKTYCPILAQYMESNFVPVVIFGHWGKQSPVVWETHGTKILKRIQH